MSRKVEQRGIKIFIDDKELKQSYHNLKKEYNKQYGILRKLDEAHPDYNKRAAEVKILKKRFEELSATQRNLISETKGTHSIFGKFKGLLGGMTGLLSGAFAVGSVVAWGEKILTNVNLLRDVKHEVKQLSNLRGTQLNQVTATSKAIADTFNKDVKETIKTADNFADHFKLTQERSLELMKRGLLEGADAGGEFYDQLKEYPALLKEAGLSAEQSIQLIIETQKNGIYNDKGVDAIKEGFLSVREGTKATQDAIKGLGIDVDQFYKDIESGNISYFDALKRISKEIDATGNKSQKTGTAIADIFKGAGEDAGYDFISSLHGMNLEMDKSIDQSDEYVQLKEREFEINEDLNRIWVQLTGTGSALHAMYLNMKSSLVNLLGSMTSSNYEALEANEAFNDQAEKVIHLNNNLKPLIEEYNNLKSKSKLSKEEQNRLKTVIEQIGGIVPTAITQFDEYGRAMDISTTRANEFIETQKRLLKHRNKDVINEEKKQIEDYGRKINNLTKILQHYAKIADGQPQNKQSSFNKSARYGGGNVKHSADEIRKLEKELEILQGLKANAEASLDNHTGDYLDKFKKQSEAITKKTAQELENRKQLEVRAAKYNIEFTEKTSDDVLRMLIQKKQDEINAKLKLDKEHRKKEEVSKARKLEADRKKSASDLEKELIDVKKAQEAVIDQKLAMMQDGYKREIEIENTRHSRRIEGLKLQKKDLSGIEDQAILESIQKYNEAIDVQIEAEKRLHEFKKEAVTQKYAKQTIDDPDKGWSSGINILGLSPEDWDETFARFEEGENRIMGWAERIEAVLNGVGQAWGMYYDYINNREADALKRFEKDTSKKKDALKDQLDKGLINQENYDKQVSKLDKDMEKQRAITEYNRAKRQKTMALFEIASQTAVAVMKAYSMSVGTLGLPWSAIIAAMGLAQAGVVSAAPLPDKGFYYGGYTGTNGQFKDQYGTVTGYVHDHEYVVPKAELEDQTVNQLVQVLEAKRTGVIDSISRNDIGTGQEELKGLVRSVEGLLSYMIEYGIDSRVSWGYKDTQELTKQQDKLKRIRNNG